MDNFTHLGLDVHKETIAVATLRPGAVACEERVIPNTPEAIRKLVAGMGDPALLRACYEAGPTGYDTHRLLSSLGVGCDVIAPALIPKRPGVRTKTDRSDARALARLNRAGELTAIRVPTTAEEALREAHPHPRGLEAGPQNRPAAYQELPPSARPSVSTPSLRLDRKL